MNEQQLFRERVVPYGLRDRQLAMESAARSLSEAEIADEKEALRTIESHGEFRVPQLDLDGTTFQRREMDGALDVIAEIPFTGRGDAFSLTPEGVGVPVVHGSVGFNSVLNLRHRFQRGASADDIKAYFRTEAGKVQQVLDHIALAVQDFNNDVPARARAARDARIEIDKANKDLDDGLEGGL